MLDALGQLDDIARSLSVEHGRPSASAIASASSAANEPLKLLAKNLDDENHNITLPGEGEIAGNLTKLWSGADLETGKKVTGDCYADAFAALTSSGVSPADRAAAYATTERLSPLLKSAAKGVIDLNLANMTPLEGRVKAMADGTARAMILLSVVGVVLAVLFTIIVGRSILQPVEALTRSAREIEQGNLDLVVQVKSRDELRQLAEAFNSMASKLREYRRTNRAKLVRTQETTQNAINSLPDAVAILSPDGTIEMANTAAQRYSIFGPASMYHGFAPNG